MKNMKFYNVDISVQVQLPEPCLRFNSKQIKHFEGIKIRREVPTLKTRLYISAIARSSKFEQSITAKICPCTRTYPSHSILKCDEPGP
jgi:hypothetical protein